MNITITTPRFTRLTGEPGPIVPPDADFFHDLGGMDAIALREFGMRPWNDPNNDDGRLADAVGSKSHRATPLPVVLAALVLGASWVPTAHALPQGSRRRRVRPRRPRR